ncbi:MAG: hypothetical protein WCG47_29130 [Dermatophilaceae bacterium]
MTAVHCGHGRTGRDGCVALARWWRQRLATGPGHLAVPRTQCGNSGRPEG